MTIVTCECPKGRAIFDQCRKPTSNTTTASDPIAGSTLLRRKERKMSRRSPSTTRSDVGDLLGGLIHEYYRRAA